MAEDLKECGDCGEIHEETQDNQCACCGQKAPEIGVHRPVLCTECSRALDEVRDDIWACPNCGERGTHEGECCNSNCRVQEFESVSRKVSHNMILEERGIA